MKSRHPLEHVPRAGFTLLELMVVVSILSIVVTLVAPAVVHVAQANRLSSCAANLANQFNLARMLSIQLNQRVEVRFYEYADRESPGSAPAYRACQIWVNGSPYQRIVSFERGVILSMRKGGSGEPWSSILDPERNPYGTNKPLPVSFEISRAIDNSSATYSCFQFQPNGSTNLSSESQWSLTLILEKDNAQTELPANFVTEVIDPLTGSVRTLRPE